MSGAAARTLITKKNVGNKYIRKVFGRLQQNCCNITCTFVNQINIEPSVDWCSRYRSI